ncbi:PREDICTED: uncharacterized protein LOC108545588 [Eufriesea mexicana]|uniref:uncharacterized protein LOC108545588 n=1 Tax=Eufriesea mexicana TaxID=516756 RepID=UPI00083C7B12|nr:PREDICTED: uncharacterized protein LOC108545588 [Eufriesea mexicana]
MYSCPAMPPAPCPPECPPSKPSYDLSSRYYREIGTTMIGNQLIIRMEREKGKLKKSKEWDPPCDCDVVEIQRPTSKQGPKILSGADNNRILFRVESKSAIPKDDDDAMTQAIAYEVGQCRGGPYTNNQCRTFTIYPILDGPGTQEVHTDRVTDGKDNVFMLRVKKKSDSVDQPRRNVELELRTPKLQPSLSEPPEVQHRTPEKILIRKEKECQPEEAPRKEPNNVKQRKKK